MRDHGVWRDRQGFQGRDRQTATQVQAERAGGLWCRLDGLPQGERRLTLIVAHHPGITSGSCQNEARFVRLYLISRGH